MMVEESLDRAIRRLETQLARRELQIRLLHESRNIVRRVLNHREVARLLGSRYSKSLIDRARVDIHRTRLNYDRERETARNEISDTESSMSEDERINQKHSRKVSFLTKLREIAVRICDIEQYDEVIDSSSRATSHLSSDLENIAGSHAVLRQKVDILEKRLNQVESTTSSNTREIVNINCKQWKADNYSITSDQK